MRNKIKAFLKNIGLFDHIKIIKEKYFSDSRSKKLFNSMVNFYSYFINEGDICFDIGANYGNRTEVLLTLGAKVIAIEPQPDVARFLKRKFGKRIIIEQIAIGRDCETKDMYISNAATISSLSSEWIEKIKQTRFQNHNWNKKIKVELKTLDYLIDKYGIPIFCKIDVEGFELEVFKGLSQPIKNLSYEFAFPEFTDKALECIERLEEIGKFECNYSKDETMLLGLENWMDPDKFKQKIKNLLLEGVNWGDIYIRFKN
ncbi:hypothetical protein ES708_26488 [subsurface metagenome]